MQCQDSYLAKPERITTLLKSTSQNIGCVVYPRSARAHCNARTPTWLNQKGYTTLFTSDSKYCLCCITQEHAGTFQCRTPTWLNQKASKTLLKSATQNIGCVVYPRSMQAHFNPRTSTWLNHKGYTSLSTSMTQNIVYVVYPRSAQEHFNARTPTWLNEKGYTTLFSSDSKYSLCCISQEH